MGARFARSGVAVSLAGLLAGVAPSSLSSQVSASASGGSEVPCAVPLAWHVARVDAEFGLSESEAATVVQLAAEMWEDAVGRRLFAMDGGGFPVRLVFDERQADARERSRRVAEIERAGEQLEERAAAARARSERLGASQAQHTSSLQAYEARVQGHNETVRRWNARGGAPEDEQRRLSRVGDELEARTRSLESDARELQEVQERLNRDVRDHNRGREVVARDFPPTAVESGVYREAIQTTGGRVTSVRREIRIYRFATPDELKLVAAHELGHALGLGHSPEPAAVMNELHGEGAGAGGPVEVHAADVGLLRNVCPSLVGGASP